PNGALLYNLTRRLSSKSNSIPEERIKSVYTSPHSSIRWLGTLYMAPRHKFRLVKRNCRLSAGNFFTQQSSLFLTREPANGSNSVRLFLRACVNFSMPWPLRRAATSNQPPNISNFELRPFISKLTLRAQASYTFSS